MINHSVLAKHARIAPNPSTAQQAVFKVWEAAAPSQKERLQVGTPWQWVRGKKTVFGCDFRWVPHILHLTYLSSLPTYCWWRKWISCKYIWSQVVEQEMVISVTVFILNTLSYTHLPSHLITTVWGSPCFLREINPTSIVLWNPFHHAPAGTSSIFFLFPLSSFLF